MTYSTTNLEEIGEIDKCPNCQTKLEHIPTRKKKCEFCGKFIYVRTRPIDRKRVLVTEKEKEEIESLWQKHYEMQEESELIAITELARVQTNAYVRSSIEFGIKKVVWNVSKDDLVCPICLALDGMEIPVEEAFDAIPNRSHLGCRCYLTSVVPENENVVKNKSNGKMKEIEEFVRKHVKVTFRLKRECAEKDLGEDK